MTDPASPALPAPLVSIPDGQAVFAHWLHSEGSKSWHALDTGPNSGYEQVWKAWLRMLEQAAPASGPRLGKVGAAALPHALPAMAWHEATAVQVQQFLQVREGQRSGHLPGRKLSEVTRRRYWRLLQRVYEHALLHSWVAHNPAQALAEQDRPPSEDGGGHCLPAALWKSLRRHFPAADSLLGARDRAVLLLLYHLALAPQEVRQLCWQDVLGADDSAWSPESGSGLPQYVRIFGQRPAQRRVLPLDPELGKALADWHRWSTAQRGSEAAAGSSEVFFSREGGPLSVRVLFHIASQRIQQAHAAQASGVQSAPLHRVGPQVLRNTAIVQWLQAGQPIDEVVAFIGVEGTPALRHLQHYL